jgi:hypothetical protein
MLDAIFIPILTLLYLYNSGDKYSCETEKNVTISFNLQATTSNR